MKKNVLIYFLLSICIFQIFSQNDSLYDVNYDEVVNTINYNDSLYVFQKIYLQYEEAISTAEKKIREEERDFYLKELENFKKAEKLRTDVEIENMRQLIYENEVELVKQKEIERLTTELTEKISKELSEKLSKEYEKNKNDEINALYENLKKRAYKEAETSIQMVKSISSASVIVIIILIIIIGIKSIIHLYKRKNIEKEQFDTLIDFYKDELKSKNGKSYEIRKNIEAQYKGKEKTIRFKALAEAENCYSSDLEEVSEYKDNFANYKTTLNNYLKIWDSNDSTNISMSLKKIEECKNNYRKLGKELYNSIELRKDADKKQALNLLESISDDLEDLSNSIKGKNIERELLREKKQLAKEFAQLAKLFKKCLKRGNFK